MCSGVPNKFQFNSIHYMDDSAKDGPFHLLLEGKFQLGNLAFDSSSHNNNNNNLFSFYINVEIWAGPPHFIWYVLKQRRHRQYLYWDTAFEIAPILSYSSTCKSF